MIYLAGHERLAVSLNRFESEAGDSSFAFAAEISVGPSVLMMLEITFETNNPSDDHTTWVLTTPDHSDWYFAYPETQVEAGLDTYGLDPLTLSIALHDLQRVWGELQAYLQIEMDGVRHALLEFPESPEVAKTYAYAFDEKQTFRVVESIGRALSLRDTV